MGDVFLISDDLQRSGRLARDLAAFRTCDIYDLYDDAPPASVPDLIVSDVRTLTSEAILRLRRLLARVRSAQVPYLCLLHEDTPRARLQAEVLGASGTLGAGAASRLLLKTLDSLQAQNGPVPAYARRQAGAARKFLREIFVPGFALTPAVIDDGVDLASDAVRETGIRDWVRAVRLFDDATHQHCLLVAGLAAAFSVTLGLSEPDRHRLAKAALLHDVGKVHVPTIILNKPGPLTAAETAVMRTHPAQGHAMLVGGGFEDALLTVVRSHHEMLDGSGYPDGLKGGSIPDLVRLVTICDIYGALIERRSYNPPMVPRRAYEILQGMAGRLDGDLVRAFIPIVAATDEVASAPAEMRS